MPPSESALVKPASSNGSSSRNNPASNYSYSEGITAPHQNTDVNASMFLPNNGNWGQTPRINSQISNSSAGDFERLSSQQALKRTLPSWADISESKGHMKEINGINNDELVMLESKNSRVLPPSMMPGRSTSATQFASSSDPIYRPALVDDRVNRNDERLIYQAALEVYS